MVVAVVALVAALADEAVAEVCAATEVTLDASLAAAEVEALLALVSAAAWEATAVTLAATAVTLAASEAAADAWLATILALADVALAAAEVADVDAAVAELAAEATEFSIALVFVVETPLSLKKDDFGICKVAP